MQRACNHTIAEQSLTIQEALRMCTYNGDWTTFDERERGSLETGKIADMVVLSENPYETPVEELGRLTVEQLLLAGKPYTAQAQSMVAAIAKGMFGNGAC